MIGSDPELFLKRDGGYVSAIGLIGGSKDHPKPVKELGKGFYVQEDNVAVEYNIPACVSPNSWRTSHMKMLGYLRELVGKKGLELSIDASASFPKEELANPKALVFGCEPDFNVWTLETNPRPHCDNPFLRSCGGHVHIAFNGTNSEKVILGRKCDMLLGLWSVINDKDQDRRKLYGTAGSIRFKPYGIEYRTLSNFWLKKEEWINRVYELATIARDLNFEIIDVSSIINEGDEKEAKKLFSKFSLGQF